MTGCNESLFTELKPTVSLVVCNYTDLLIVEEINLITRKLVTILPKWQKVTAEQ
jgi:ABC-type uncharacterized transport system YnjBCD substrate-binding protein